MIPRVFGLFDRLKKRRLGAQARRRELRGELAGAVEAYLDAGLSQDAARTLLLRADAVTDPEKRLALCAQAARIGGDGEQGKLARRRQALLSFDLVRSAAGATLQGELLQIARQLECSGEWEKAAQAYALAGDQEAEIRVLEEAGAIEQLEERLHSSSAEARRERNRHQLLRRLADLDAIAERREALQSGREWLEQGPDEAVEVQLAKIRSKLLAGPLVSLEVHGELRRYALGSEITIGRANADIMIPSSSVSRQHLRLFRRAGAPFVEDLDTRNGTSLAGARITTPLPVGAQGVALELAGRVPCSLKPAGGAEPAEALLAEVAGERYVIPLGPLHLGDWQIVDAHDGGDRFVVLRCLDGKQPPLMRGYRLASQIELCAGDELCARRGGPPVLRVPNPAQTHPGALG